MPSYMRRWAAREGHEGVLRQELLRLHQTHAPKNPHLMESMLYREHFAAREFIGLAVYDDEAAVESRERRALLSAFDKLAAAHAETITPSHRVEMLHEFVTIPRTASNGMAALLRCEPDHVPEVTARLEAIARDIVDRLAPVRFLVGHAADEPGTFFVLGDSQHRVDLDRYLQSSLHRDHQATLERFLVAPARWYSLDPVWRYFRSSGADARGVADLPRPD